jgi:hypothetical protein
MYFKYNFISNLHSFYKNALSKLFTIIRFTIAEPFNLTLQAL